MLLSHFREYFCLVRNFNHLTGTKTDFLIYLLFFLSFLIYLIFLLKAMVDTLDAAKLWLFPQIFWAAVALLNTDFEQEYLQAIRLLSKLVTRFNFSDIAVQNVFLNGIPNTWYLLPLTFASSTSPHPILGIKFLKLNIFV